MDFFCLPVIFGCSTTVSPDAGQPARVCPNCHNAAVSSGKKRTWFELCCVPVFPLSSKHVWICTICQWSIKTSEFEPQLPVYQNQYPPQGQYQPYPQQGGYQQGYPPPGQPSHK